MIRGTESPWNCLPLGTPTRLFLPCTPSGESRGISARNHLISYRACANYDTTRQHHATITPRPVHVQQRHQSRKRTPFQILSVMRKNQFLSLLDPDCRWWLIKGSCGCVQGFYFSSASQGKKTRSLSLR